MYVSKKQSSVVCASSKNYIVRPCVYNYKVPAVQKVGSVYNDFIDTLTVFSEAIEGKVKVSNGLVDGRLVSFNSEDEVTSLLFDMFPHMLLGKDNIRSRGDVYVKLGKDYIFPINVKLISNKSKSYNNICGVATTVGMLLYGKKFHSLNEMAYTIKEEVPFTEDVQHYGVIAINKLTGSTTPFTLYNVTDLYVNPTNGVQFKLDGLTTTYRTQKEGQLFLKNKVQEFFDKRAEPSRIING